MDALCRQLGVLITDLVPAAIACAAITSVGTAIYPEDYGAVGDGQHDDSIAMQKAIDAAAGSSLRLSDGRTYLISVGLIVAAPTIVTGGKILATENRRSRRHSRGSDSVIRFTRNAVGSELRSLEIDLAGNGRGAVRIEAVDMVVDSLTIRNYRKTVKADNVLHSKSESGLRIAASNANVTDVHCENMQTTVPDAVPRCITIHGNATGVSLANISGRNINGGITIGSSTDITIDGFDFRNLTDNGLYILPGSNHLTARNGYIENINESIVFKGRNSIVDGLRIHNQEQAIGLENATGILLANVKVSFDEDLATSPSFIRTRRDNKHSSNIVIRDVDADIPFGNAILNIATGQVKNFVLKDSTFRLRVNESRARKGQLYLIRQNHGEVPIIENSTFSVDSAAASVVKTLSVKAPDLTRGDLEALQSENVFVRGDQKLTLRGRTLQ